MKTWDKIIHYPRIGLVFLAFIAFIALGMPDGLMGVAWPSIRNSFSLSLDSIGILITAGVIGYMTSSFLSGPLISKWGVGHVLAVSCLLTGIALIGYTLVPSWWIMVLLGVLSGLGAGAIDAGLNTYVAANFGAGLMQWLHASYGIGVTFGPIIMTISLTAMNSWRIGYRVVGGFQLGLAICFVLTLGMWNRPKNIIDSDEPKRMTDYKTSMGKTLRQSRVWLSALLFFIYVGVEVSLGTWTYSLLTESRGIDPTLAGLFTGSYWATFTIGRIVAGVIAKKTGIDLLIQGSVMTAFIGALLLLWNPFDMANVIAVAIIGFAIAPVFPALMSGTGQRVGTRYAANTIGIQMAASGLGSASITSLLGVMASHFSLEIIPFSFVVLFIGLFGFYRLSINKEKAIQERI